MDTLPKVMALCYPEIKFETNKSYNFLKLFNGSEIWIGGLDDKDRVEKVLGNEYTTMYLNEASQISYHAFSTAQTRLAQKTEIKNRFYIDCNPPTKSHWLYSYFFEKIDPETRVLLPSPEIYAEMRLNPEGNRENLPDGYIETVLGGLTDRKRKRFKEGEWLDDLEGALWTRDIINVSRVTGAPQLIRIVIGVDPAVTSGENSDETGIVVVGLSSNHHCYVLQDASLRGSPFSWATAVKKAYDRWNADRVIGEINNGGELVEVNLRTVDKHLPFAEVHASRGKQIRAEPVAALYEKGTVHHVGEFPELEDQMVEWVPGEKSPDRMDALVWAVTFLLGLDGEGAKPSLDMAEGYSSLKMPI
jgi:hypothetical protein